MNKTKQRILNCAQKVFLENSYDGTAIDSIINRVNVSKGSFFHHFKSKSDLLEELIDYEADNLFAKLEQILDKPFNPLKALNDFLNWRYESYSETGRLISKLGSEVGDRTFILQKKIKKIYGEYLSFLIKIIEEAKEQGQLSKATPSRELANFILYGLEGGSMSVNLVDNKAQYHDLVQMIKRVIRSYRNLEAE